MGDAGTGNRRIVNERQTSPCRIIARVVTPKLQTLLELEMILSKQVTQTFTIAAECIQPLTATPPIALTAA